MTLPILAGLFLLLTASLTSAEDDKKTLREWHEIHGDTVQASHVAFECSALASYFDSNEHRRLLRYGYKQGKTYMTDFTNKYIDLNKSFFDSPAEYVAFTLGQNYEAAYRTIMEEVPTDEDISEKMRESVYRREFEQRDCSLIGK